MRELSTHESDQAAGGVITVDRKGNLTASEGVTTFQDGAMTIKTTDGWMYERACNGYWQITNADGVVVNDELIWELFRFTSSYPG